MARERALFSLAFLLCLAALSLKTIPITPTNPNLLPLTILAIALILATSSLLTLRHGPKETHLVLYVHDNFKGNDASAVTVAGRAGAASNILQFGTVAVVDDEVTEGPEPGSKAVGRAQGVYVNSAMDGTALYMVFSVAFAEGRFKGSTLEIQGYDPFKLEKREFSVVSGTGAFRFVRGYGIMETEFMDVANLRATIKLTITVRHV